MTPSSSTTGTSASAALGLLHVWRSIERGKAKLRIGTGAVCSAERGRRHANDDISELVGAGLVEDREQQVPPDEGVVRHVLPVRQPLGVKLVDPVRKRLIVVLHLVDLFRNWSTALTR